MVSDGNGGCPKFDINVSLLRTLLEDEFTVPNIVGVSISTVR